MRKTENISVTLTIDQAAELQKIADRTKIKKSTLVQQAVDVIIDKYKEQLELPINN